MEGNGEAMAVDMILKEREVEFEIAEKVRRGTGKRSYFH